ncbi:AAA family ATPase [Magnetovibrio sp. PR-2]|uniref:AAA family ATPase n=1 Tax=Magnetovibrio sp. PR-2 TaxID=3120356 RepID=UPI002FCE42C8
MMTPNEIASAVALALETMSDDDCIEIIRLFAEPATQTHVRSMPTGRLKDALKEAGGEYARANIEDAKHVRWFFWVSCAVEERHIRLAALMLAYALHKKLQLSKHELAYLQATHKAILVRLFGTLNGPSIDDLMAVIRVYANPWGDAFREGAEPNQILPELEHSLHEDDLEQIVKILDADRKAGDGWAFDGDDNSPDLDKALAGDADQFCALSYLVHDKLSSAVLARLAGLVARDTDCGAARLLVRAFRAGAQAELNEVDTSTLDEYLHTRLDGLDATEMTPANDDQYVPDGHVILAPNMPSADAMSGERRRILKDFAVMREPLKLLEPQVSVDELRNRLLAEFPWMEQPIDLICKDLVLRQSYGQREYSLPPLLIHGAPGTGKTRFVQRLAKVLGIPSDMLSLSGAADDRMLRGTGFGWSSANPSYPVNKIAETKVANPILVFDEVDKTKADGRNGDPVATLLMMTERENAAGYFDECLMAGVNLSYVNFVATANDIAHLPLPFLNRFRVIETPKPEAEHLRAIIGGVRSDFADEVGVDHRFIPDLSEAEVMFLEGIFAKYGNVRTVIRMVQKLLGRRERMQREQPN